MTAKPQPNVMTIQPEFWALDLFSRTAATTPSPKRIRSAVPIVSPPMMLKSFSLLDELGTGATLISAVRQCQTQFAYQQTGSSDHRRVGRVAQDHPIHRARRRDPAAAVGPHAAARRRRS